MESHPRPASRKNIVIAALCATAICAGAVALALGAQLTVYGEERPAAGEAPVEIVDSSDDDAPEKIPAADQVPQKIGASADGISPDELSYARALVGETEEYAATTDVYGNPGAQFVEAVVLVDDVDSKRRLTMNYYDYSGLTGHSWVVNLSEGSVEEHVASAELQLVPSDAEVEVAYEILLASDQGAELKRQFMSLTGEELTDLSQTVNRARTYVPTPGEIGGEPCTTNRCVVILMKTPTDSLFLPTNTVAIDLVDHAVYTLS